MAETLSGVNGEIIRWARELYNLSPDEVARAIGVDESRYLSWESGDKYPTYAQLKKISEVLKKPSAVFFFPEPPKIREIKGDLRTLPSIVVKGFSKNVVVQFEQARAYQIDLQELYGSRPSILTRRELVPNDIENLCSFFRYNLQFTVSEQKAVRDAGTVFEVFREKLYDLGIYVFKDAFKDDNVSGICINDNYYPVILINNSMSFARQNFTLFHELYHLILNTNGAELIKDDFYAVLNQRQAEEEKMCDTFANAFLVPTEDFKDELIRGNREINEELISELSTVYSVSKEAIMYKLNKLGRITSKEYSYFKEKFYGDTLRRGKKGQPGSGGNFYNTRLSYLGKKYAKDVLDRYYSNAIDIFEASEMLRCKVDQLEELGSRLS